MPFLERRRVDFYLHVFPRGRTSDLHARFLKQNRISLFCEYQVSCCVFATKMNEKRKNISDSDGCQRDWSWKERIYFDMVHVIFDKTKPFSWNWIPVLKSDRTSAFVKLFGNKRMSIEFDLRCAVTCQMVTWKATAQTPRGKNEKFKLEEQVELQSFL